MLGTTTITVTPQTGTYTSGRLVRTAGTAFTCVASVQDVEPRQVEVLPEADRVKCRKVAYVRQAVTVKTSDPSTGAPADRITYGGRTYVVMSVRDLRDHTTGLPNIEVIMAEVGADE